MSFDSAIPINRLAQVERSIPDFGSGRGSTGKEKYPHKNETKQQVNISPDTMLRLARTKLSNAVNQKMAYTRRGSLPNNEQPVGQLFSAKA